MILDLAAIKRAARELPTDALPDLVAELEAAKAIAWSRLVTPAAPAASPAVDAANMTADELSAVFHVPRSFFYELARQGRVPCLRLGRYVRFNRAAVEQALEMQNTKTPALATRKKPRSDGTLRSPATALLPREVLP